MAPDDAEEPEQVELTFREQSDGRKVSRLPSGKVVLIELASLDRVKDGERWIVQLSHKDMFAVAKPLHRIDVAKPAPAAGPAETLPRTLAPPPKPSDTSRIPAIPAKPVAVPRETPAVRDGAAPTPPSQVIRPGDRVAFFVDAANMEHASRDAGYFVDYAKAATYFTGPGSYYGGFFFVADFTTKDSLQVRYLDFLAHHGYVLRKKAVKVIHDEESGEERYKANTDVELAVDMLNTSDNYDVAFLFSGDSDFERLVDVLRSRGKRIYVVSARGSLSRELTYVADKPVFYLEEHRAALERTQTQ